MPPVVRDPAADEPDELGLEGAALERVLAPLPRRRRPAQPYQSVEETIAAVSNGAADSTATRLQRGANLFTPAQRAAIVRETRRLTERMIQRFAERNAANAADPNSSSSSSSISSNSSSSAATSSAGEVRGGGRGGRGRDADVDVAGYDFQRSCPFFYQASFYSGFSLL
ncbi:uncharacterized protein LY79DRAFT_678338 [Colletotrichum navitas]|uniref:Uncharacterized protein n=1 Tax=Colletotrichum navitas TaxID=681940 RepID=A0AAD8PLS9_9PEZI|nr:uncharacterized protein LY79DRAFT_678338 [Colletotrichum navitas]KAK1570086.1 hypothetical protein LY79DRAFT_678338 [Colletotrichum navitas]